MGNKQYNILLVGSALFYIASFIPGLSFLQLIFLAPLLVILDDLGRKVNLKWLAGLYLVLVAGSFTGIILNEQSLHAGLIFYPLGLTISVAFGIYISTILKGSIKSIALISFWLGYNYLILKLMPNWSIYFVFNNLFNNDFHWTTHTGFLGVALWALLSNIIISKRVAITSDKLIDNPLLLSIITVIIGVPIWISYFYTPEGESIDQATMFMLYSHGDGIARYAERGEWIARTGAWLAVLISVYGLIKRKTTK